MRIAFILLIAFAAACDKSASAPPPNTQQATRGLPPIGQGPASAAAAPAAPGATLEGTILVLPELIHLVNPGDTLFLVARAVDANGNVQRMPVAVDRARVGQWPLPFKLSADNVMVAGTPFAGPMQLTARIDKDGEAMTREAGDIEGTVMVTVPQKGITITLDTPVKP